MPTRIERWRSWLQGRPTRFILVVGVIGWGVPFGLLTPLVVLAVVGELELLAWMYSFFLPLSLVGGLAFGALMWRKMQQFRAAGIQTVGRDHGVGQATFDNPRRRKV